MKFGKYDCYPLDMGSFRLDGGAMFGVVPKVLWSLKFPADNKNRIPMMSRSLLLRSDDKVILIDTGCGNKFDVKQKKIYGVESISNNIDQQLNDVNLCVNDITDVILTHLHFDHSGGATEYKNGKVVPTFPNATYYVHKYQWEAALYPTKRDTASYLPENYVPLKENGVLKFLEDGIAPIEGIELLVSNGHTKAQILPLIQSEISPLFYCGDLIPTSAHIPIAWHMGYDNYPLEIIKEKKRILERAYTEKWILFFEHDPQVSACTLKKGSKGIELAEIITF